MNDEPRRGADDPGHASGANPADPPDEGPGDHAMPLPASAADERHASDPIESDESIAGEEDPGAALDDGTDPRARKDDSRP